MAISIAIILLIFIIAFSGVWFWYFRNETAGDKNFYKSGAKAFKNNDYAKAKELLIKALGATPNHKEAQYKLGLIYMEEKDYTKAKECFEKALKTSPKDFDTLYNYALTLQNQDELEGAKELYNRALKENAQNPDCYMNLGIINLKQGDVANAMQLLEKAHELAPGNPQISFSLTKCKDELCNYETPEEGQAVIDEYLKIAKMPNLPEDFGATLSKAYAKNGQLDKALDYCQKCLKEQSENVECYALLGLIQLIKRDLVGAKNTLSTALNLEPGNEELHEILSYTLCQQENKCAVKKCREKYKALIKNFVKPK